MQRDYIHAAIMLAPFIVGYGWGEFAARYSAVSSFGTFFSLPLMLTFAGMIRLCYYRRYSAFIAIMLFVYMILTLRVVPRVWEYKPIQKIYIPILGLQKEYEILGILFAITMLLVLPIIIGMYYFVKSNEYVLLAGLGLYLCCMTAIISGYVGEGVLGEGVLDRYLFDIFGFGYYQKVREA